MYKHIQLFNEYSCRYRIIANAYNLQITIEILNVNNVIDCVINSLNIICYKDNLKIHISIIIVYNLYFLKD